MCQRLGQPGLRKANLGQTWPAECPYINPRFLFFLIFFLGRLGYGGKDAGRQDGKVAEGGAGRRGREGANEQRDATKQGHEEVRV